MAIRTRISTHVRGRTKVRSYGNSRFKRAYDLGLGIGLLLLSSPVLIPAIVLNTFVTRGHPFFVQRRAGKNGANFGLIKLRTMRRPTNDEVWNHRTEIDDSRITLFGRMLRRFYVDELPQLLNVVLGHMSMIGPRPETPEITTEISSSKPRFIERIAVKPGISGVAQVYFRKPGSDHDLWRRYYYDRVYMVRCSFGLDLKLTALTFLHVLRNKGN